MSSSRELDKKINNGLENVDSEQQQQQQKEQHDKRLSNNEDENDPCISNDRTKRKKRKHTQFWTQTEQTLRLRTGLSRNWLRIVAALTLATFVLLVVVICLSAFWPRKAHHQQFPVCQHADCLTAVAQIRNGLNTTETASLCADFWSWMCGGWLANNPLPRDRSKWNPREQLKHQDTISIRELITTLASPIDATTIEWKMKYLYESCAETENVDADGVRPLLRVITDLGGWHIMREWSVHSWDYRRVLERLHTEYGATPFFQISLEPNPRSPLTNSIRILPAGLGLPDRSFYYFEPDHKISIAYKRLLKDIVIKLRATSSEASKFSNDIFYFEKRIAEITPDSFFLQNPINTYNPISVSELKITAASLPLREILVSMFPNAGITEETEMIVSSPDYLTAVSGIVSSTDRSALNNYLIWTLVRQYLPYLPSDFTAELHQYAVELNGVEVPLERWEFCTNVVEKFMGFAVQSLLENRNPIENESNKQTVGDIFEKIRAASIIQINQFHLTAELHKHVTQKAKSLTVQIGLPKNLTTSTYLKNFYMKFYVQKSNLFQNVINGFAFQRNVQQQYYLNPQYEYRFIRIPSSIKEYINVEYLPASNTIVVPRALLTYPYFKNAYPKSILYGRIGVDIANAVIASILPWGSFWTKNQGLLSPYHQVVNQSLKAIENSKKCLQNFISKQNYVITEDVAGITSLATFKHLSALQLAYIALELSLENREHVHQPTLETLEDAELFYITYTQNHCSRHSQQQQLHDNFINFHLTEKNLLQVAWQQDSRFANSLHCTTNTTSKCIMAYS